MSLYQQPTHILKSLAERTQKGLLKKLKTDLPPIDFCSNDYLGFSKTGILSQCLDGDASTDRTQYGATGSRLVSGNSVFIEEAEKQIALFHHGRSALIFNSGYDANLGLLSAVPQKTDLILYDELLHASALDGIRLSQATHYKFKHNNVEALEELIYRHHKTYENIYVVVESVYSLDGDSAPLLELAEICEVLKNIFLIVDEAHAIGVFGKQGRGLCSALGMEQRCFARIYTYGKALGCNGASVVGSEILRNYLINFSRPFMYSTALPQYNIEAILQAYRLLIETDNKDVLQSNIAYFYSKTSGLKNLVKSQSAIHTLHIGNNEQVDAIEHDLAEKNISCRAFKSPTVKPGTERIRFCIHSFNTREEMDQLVEVISTLKDAKAGLMQ
ncbi:MAG: aminotransferase class I/II-fold pyridoxal phosphate-dependent enzyme [Bacteroidia bacterium]|nr:aminotransferase class I/II-fold pyridoxal phosphate-dependent enzyme [Bacteroidia bacterium]